MAVVWSHRFHKNRRNLVYYSLSFNRVLGRHPIWAAASGQTTIDRAVNAEILLEVVDADVLGHGVIGECRFSIFADEHGTHAFNEQHVSALHPFAAERNLRRNSHPRHSLLQPCEPEAPLLEFSAGEKLPEEAFSPEAADGDSRRLSVPRKVFVAFAAEWIPSVVDPKRKSFSGVDPVYGCVGSDSTI